MGIKKTGDWAGAVKTAELVAKHTKQASLNAMKTEAKYLQKLVRKNLTSRGAVAGKPFEKWSEITRVIRSAGGGGGKVLRQSGALWRGVYIKKMGSGWYVGSSRMTPSGKDLAQVHEYGRTYKATKRQRNFIMAVLRENNMLDGTGGNGSGVMTIRIPPRPYFWPVIERFATPKMVEDRYAKNFKAELKKLTGK